jgi:hypothetical protein
MHREGEAPEFVVAVRRLPGVQAGPPAPAAEIDRLEEWAGVTLPGPHRAMLLRANGVLAAGGFERILGVGEGPMHIGPWNALETWKFSWPELPLEDYLVFAENAFGDQFAYRVSDLRRGIDVVQRLDRHLMQPGDEPAADDFEAFLRGFFERAQDPDDEVVMARGEVGEIAVAEHAVLSPPPVVEGSARTARLTRMSARAGMIAAGDLATQLLSPGTEQRDILRLETYHDELDRPRLRVIWA